jgi:site-specific DNA recombinase
MLRVAFYARVSGRSQKEEQTIESQLAALKEFAATEGFQFDAGHFYIDNGYSGFYFDRPDLDRLRDDARDGLIDVVLVHDPDRLARRYAYQVLLIEELQRWGVQVRFIEQPPADSPDQKLLVQIQGAIAEYERARILERTRRGRLFWARQGRPVSSVVPFGYRYIPRGRTEAPRVEVDESESEVVVMIFRWYVDEGLNMRQTALRLTSEGVATPTGRSAYWDPSTNGSRSL